MPTRDQYMQALRQADAAGNADEAQRIAAMMKADTQAQAPAPPAPPPGMDTSGLPTDPAARQAAITKRANDSTLAGMSTSDKLLAGMGKGFNDTLQGTEQLGAWLGSKVPGSIGDYYSRMGQQIKDERATNAPADSALTNTAAGKTGEIGSMLATAAVPIGGTEALGARALEAAGGNQTAQLLARALSSRTGQGVMAGMAQGAVQPVTDDSERAGNMAISGAFGGAAPQAGRVLKAVAALGGHLPGVKLLAPLLGFDSGAASATKQAAAAAADRFAIRQAQMASDKAATQAAREAAAAAKIKAAAVRAQAAKDMGSILNENVNVPIGQDVASELKGIQNQYTGSLSGDAHAALDKVQAAARLNNGTVRGDMIARMRAGALKEADNNKGAVSDAYSAIQRSLDKAVDQHLSPDDAMRLARARTMYRTGVEPQAPQFNLNTPLPPVRNAPGSRDALNAWLAQQGRINPNMQLYQDAAVRGALQSTQQ